MTEDEFVQALNGLASYQRYLNHGFDHEYVKRRMAGYSPVSRQKTENLLADNPLVRLVEYYDVSNTEIGMIGFNNVVHEDESYFFVGRFETDPLCVSKLNLEVVTLQFDNPSNQSYRCAKDSSLFLKAILLSAKLLEECVFDDNLYDNQTVICSMSEECADTAGGRDYLPFYKVLLGCGF